MISVLVGAAEPIYRLGLRAACEAAGLSVAAELAGGGALLSGTGVKPSVVVTEPSLLEPDAPATVERATVRHRVLIIDAPGVDKPRMLRAGASGFLPRTIDPLALRRAVEAADAGELVLPRLDGTPDPPAPAEVPRLTPRESDVLRALAEGGSTHDCAQLLHLSITTVKTHLRSANAKLGTTSRTSAAAKAVALGLLDVKPV